MLFIDILSIIIIERRFLSTLIYISLILIRITTFSLIGIIILAPFLSILYIYLLILIPVNSSASLYSFLN
jgi:hypothetical protein